MTEASKEETRTFDPIWEKDMYGFGKQLNRYPYDSVVSFGYHNYPRDKKRSEVRILEVGGAGNNLGFAAREGFEVAGIDASHSAVEYTRKRFEEDGLIGDLRVGDFTQLPFKDNYFDLAIDRASLTCCGFSAANKAVMEIHRVLKEDRTLFFNTYSDRHSGRNSGRLKPDGTTTDITMGTLVGVGRICFYNRRDIDTLFSSGWNLLSIQHVKI